MKDLLSTQLQFDGVMVLVIQLLFSSILQLPDLIICICLHVRNTKLLSFDHIPFISKTDRSGWKKTKLTLALKGFL